MEIGPEAGIRGGNIIFQGDMSEMKLTNNSLTSKYLSGEKAINIPAER